MEESIKRLAIENKYRKQETKSNEKNGYFKVFLKYRLKKFLVDILNLFRKNKNKSYYTPIIFEVDESSDEKKYSDDQPDDREKITSPYQKIDNSINDLNCKLMENIVHTPAEIQEKILSFVEKETLKNLSQASRYFAETSRNLLEKYFNNRFNNKFINFRFYASNVTKIVKIEVKNIDRNTTYKDLAERGLNSKEKKEVSLSLMFDKNSNFKIEEHGKEKLGTMDTQKEEYIDVFVL